MRGYGDEALLRSHLSIPPPPQTRDTNVTRMAIITGAGWSAAAGWPSVAEILDSGSWIVSRSQASRHSRIQEAYRASGLSGDAFMVNVRDGRVEDVAWGDLVAVIGASVASVNLRLSPLVSPRYATSLMRSNPYQAHLTLVAKAQAANEVLGVVSLNWDLLVEQVLRPRRMLRPPSPGFHYGGLPRPQVVEGRLSSPFPRDRAMEALELTGSVPVFKPHGSLNWHRVDLDWDGRRVRIVIYPDLRAAFRGRGEAAIIPPVAEEHSVPHWLAEVWAGAADLLASVDEWLVVGYSLPEYDVAFAKVLRAAACAGRLRAITVRNATDRTRSRWEAIACGATVRFAGPL